MKNLLIILFILFSSSLFGQTIYYVSSSTGNDANNGTSPSTPFKTVYHATTGIMNYGMHAGDKVLFKRGDVFPCGADNININLRGDSGTASSYIVIGAYGTGANPIINGMVDLAGWNVSTNWTNTTGNIWRKAYTSNTNRLWVNGVEWGRNSNNTTPDATEKWSYDNTYMYVYSTGGNPATAFTSMQQPLNAEGVVATNEGYIIFENLDIRGFSSGFNLTGCHDIIIQNDSIGYNCTGTGIYIEPGTNPISSNILVTNCTFNTNDHFWHTWEAKASEDGVHVKQGADNIVVSHSRFINWGHAANYWLVDLNSSYHITNCAFKNNYYTSPDINYGYGPCADFGNDYNSKGNKIDSNLIYHTGLAIQVNGPYLEIFDNVIDGTYGNSFYSPEGGGIDLTGYYGYPQYERIYNNTIINCTGYGILLHNGGGDSILQHNFIANNILANNKGELTYQRGTFTYEQLLIEENPEIKSDTFYNNLMYAAGHTNMVYYGHEPNGNYDMTVATFNSWNGNAGDVISGNITGDPLLTSNYKLQAGSPAINAGINLGVGTDLGAYSYVASSIPTVNSGDTITIYLTDGNSVNIDGSNIKGATSYNWKEVSSTLSGATIVSPTSQSTNITGLPEGTFKFELSTTGGFNIKDTTVVIVKAARPTTTVPPPTIVVSPSKTITTDSTTITGTPTWAAGHTGTITWTQIAGNPASISGIHLQTPTLYGLSGTSTFKCTAVQDDGQTTYGEVSVTVATVPPPTIYAGNNQNLSANTTNTTLTATYTIATGYTGTFNWVQESGPNTATLSTPTNYTTGLSNLVPGTYRFGCTLTQSDGQTAYDYVLVTVAVPPPILTITPDTLIHTTGANIWAKATTSAGYTVNYEWTTTSSAGIVSPYDSSTTIASLTTGTYVITCKATQSDGQYTTKSMTITVILPPTADAGPDQTITLPQTTAVFNGSATSATGHTVTYSWTKKSGGGTQTIVNNTTLTPTVKNMLTAGTYTYTLKVLQDDGQFATDDINVIVLESIEAGLSKWIHVKTIFIPKS